MNYRSINRTDEKEHRNKEESGYRSAGTTSLAELESWRKPEAWPELKELQDWQKLEDWQTPEAHLNSNIENRTDEKESYSND